MGCGTSLSRKGSKLTAISNFDDDEDIDWAVGFNARASAHNCWGGHQAADAREASDEFRVMRVSSLSGQVTLYVAGGQNKKPTQYADDRACPLAEDQPPHCTRCPFCPGNEGKTPPNVLAFDECGVELPTTSSTTLAPWCIRVFPNIFPMLICPTSFYGEQHKQALQSIPHSVVAAGTHSNHKVATTDRSNPIYHQVDAIGASEVVVESPVHNALLALQDPERIALLLKALVCRGKALAEQPWCKQLLFFKQYGPLSGGSLVHPHTQVVSLPVLPPPLISRLENSLTAHATHKRCATCLACVDPFSRKPDKIVDGEISKVHKLIPTGLPVLGKTGSNVASAAVSPNHTPGHTPRTPEEREEETAAGRLVHMTEHFVVSVPYASSSQYSMTIAPKRHAPHFLDTTTAERADLAEIMALLAQALYYGLGDPSYNIFIRTAPAAATLKVRGREVSKDEIQRCYHWILEFRPRFPADLGGFEIASGVRVVGGLPEDHAAELRGWIRERLQAGTRPVQPHLEFDRIASKASLSSQGLQRISPRGGTPPTRTVERSSSRTGSKKLGISAAWEEGRRSRNN